MTEIPGQELGNRTADVLRRVQAGERLTITFHGHPVAELTPVNTGQRSPITRAELVRRLERAQADPGLRQDLAILAGETVGSARPLSTSRIQ